MEERRFEDIISLSDARRACEEGVLVRTLLFPTEFGGEDVPQNVIYVPVKALDVQSTIIKMLTDFVREQGVIRLHVTPEYRGDSFVPSRIIYQAFPRDARFAPIFRAASIW